MHLSACHTKGEQAVLASYIDQYRHLDIQVCLKIWTELWGIKTGQEFIPELSSSAKNCAID